MSKTIPTRTMLICLFKLDTGDLCCILPLAQSKRVLLNPKYAEFKLIKFTD